MQSVAKKNLMVILQHTCFSTGMDCLMQWKHNGFCRCEEEHDLEELNLYVFCHAASGSPPQLVWPDHLWQILLP